jgi:hypothetical protein
MSRSARDRSSQPLKASLLDDSPRPLAAAFARDSDRDRPAGARRQVDRPRDRARRRSGRRRVEGEAAAPHHLIQSAIDEDRAGGQLFVGQPVAAARPHRAAQLEDVGEVGIEGEPETEPRRRRAEIPQLQADEQSFVAEHAGPQDMHGLARPPRAVRVVEIGVGEVDRQHGVVLGHRRGQEQRPQAVDGEREARQIAGVLEEQSLGQRPVDVDVAELIEHDEAVIVLEDVRARRRYRGGRRDVERRELGVGRALRLR